MAMKLLFILSSVYFLCHHVVEGKKNNVELLSPSSSSSPNDHLTTTDIASPILPSVPPTLTDVFVGGKDGYACYRIPAIISTPKGLYAFAEGRKYNCGDHGYVDLVMKSSTDNGVTWSALTTVRSQSTGPKNTTTVGNPAPVYLASSSTILLPYCINNQHAYFLTSTDYGQTWSEPVALPPIYTSWIATGPPGSLQLPSGRILIPFDRQNSTVDYSSQAYYSDDQGKTWSIADNDILHGNEAQITSVPWINSSTLIMGMRTTETFRGISFSYDSGTSWGPLIPIINETDCEGSIVSLPHHSSGPIIVISSAFSTVSRINMTLHISRDNGRTFIPEILVYSGPSAYSSLINLEPPTTTITTTKPFSRTAKRNSSSLRSGGVNGGGGNKNEGTQKGINASPSVGLLFEADNYTRIVYCTITIN